MEGGASVVTQGPPTDEGSGGETDLNNIATQ